MPVVKSWGQLLHVAGWQREKASLGKRVWPPDSAVCDQNQNTLLGPAIGPPS
jgi:hypothetical protein